MLRRKNGFTIPANITLVEEFYRYEYSVIQIAASEFYLSNIYRHIFSIINCQRNGYFKVTWLSFAILKNSVRSGICQFQVIMNQNTRLDDSLSDVGIVLGWVLHFSLSVSLSSFFAALIILMTGHAWVIWTIFRFSDCFLRLRLDNYHRDQCEMLKT